MKNHSLKLGGWLALACLSAINLPAANFYVDPVNGSASGDGSQGDPWASLQSVIENHVESQKPQNYPYDGTLEPRNSGAPIQPGDTILLMSGDHGAINLYGWYNAGEITIQGADGEDPVLRSWTLKGGKNWTLKNLTVSKEPHGTPGTGSLVSFAGHGWHGPASHCKIENCHVYTVDDISSWTASDWTSTAGSGISLGGANMTAIGNLVRNIDMGITVGGANGLVQYNDIINFSGDGLRGNGDYGVFEYNLVMDCYNVDGNHDDGFQSWADDGGGPGSGVRYGMVLRGNVIIETSDPNRQLLGPLQGIGCFDGMFEDWVIENNVVAIDQWHGITLLGATNCKIVNNTVVDLGIRDNRPWIEIGPHKNGTASTGNIVRNNIARQLRDRTNGGMTSSNNIFIDIPSYSTYFVDYLVNDYRLVTGSPAIDVGTSTDAPLIDIMGDPRPQGSGYDVGAYEFAPAIQIVGNGADNQIDDAGGSTWPGNGSARVGGATGSTEGAAVYVFELPALPSGETVLNANFDFTLLNIANGTFAGAADLYGLPWRSSSTVVAATDFYHGDYDGDPNAMAIQDTIMTNTQPLGVVSTDATGDWNLTAYIAAQYASGAQAGDYVFLRVNSNQLNHAPYRFWEVKMANKGDPADYPVLSVEIGPGNLPPFADPGTDQTATDSDGDGSASVSLDGTASQDLDGTISSYVWKSGGQQIATGANPSVDLAIGIHEIELTVTDDDADSHRDETVATVVSRTLTSGTHYSQWPQSALPTQTGQFAVEFDAVPNDNGIDGVTGLSSGVGDWWSDLACIVRFNTSGNIDVRDGSSYAADATLAYSSGTTYHVRMEVDIDNHTYSVFVTPDGGGETALATDYDFRTEQQSIISIDNWTLNATNSVGTHTVSNLTIVD